MAILTIDEVFRDFETDGVPSSGAHKPIKRDIRDTLNAVVSSTIALAADQAAMKALDTTKFKTAIDTSDGFTWRFLLGDYAARVASDPRGGLFRKADDLAAASGAWVRSYSGRLNASWFGTDQTAIQSALALSDRILVDRPYSITANATWAKNISIAFGETGSLEVATAVTLTVYSRIRAERRTIFTFVGTGKVVGIRSVVPEWFGAAGDGVTNDQPALQRAHDCVMGSAAGSGGWPTVALDAVTYQVFSPWVTTPKASVPLRITAAGNNKTIIRGNSAFTGTMVFHMQGQSNASAERIANWDIGDFGIAREAGCAAIVGFWAGGAGTDINLVGTQNSRLRNIYVDNFQYCWLFNQIRLTTIKNCSGWSTTITGGVGVRFECTDPLLFTGDLDFYNCQFVNERQGNSSCVFVENVGAGTINGVAFYRCIYYHSDTAVSFKNTSGEIGDWWFQNCQFDGQMGTGVLFAQDNAGGRMHSIYFDNCYMQGLNGPAVSTAGVIAGSFQDMFFTKFWIRGAVLGSDQLFRMQGPMSGIHIQNCIFAACATTGALITFFDVATELDVSHNTVRSHNGATAAQFLLLGATTNRYAAVANKASASTVTSMVVELNGSATKYVAGNF